jgi:MerR family transcriptional regulator, light-induced transcriptional regulator
LVAGLSTGEVASRVGVCASTLRSWDRRYGLGPSGRSTGGHRRYTLGDLARLQRARRFIAAGMSTADAVAAALAHPGPTAGAARGARLRRLQQFSNDELIRRLVEAADALDSHGIGSATRALINGRGVIRTWVDVLTPLLQQIGQYWQQQQDGVECEHVIADAVQAVLLTYAWGQETQHEGQPIALLAATPAEGHTLPLYALGAALAERGIHARVIGAVPPASLLMALDQLDPTAVVFWARTQDTVDSSLLEQVRDHVPLLCAAGEWPPGLPARAITTTDLAGAVRAVADWMQPAA